MHYNLRQFVHTAAWASKILRLYVFLITIKVAEPSLLLNLVAVEIKVSQQQRSVSQPTF